VKGEWKPPFPCSTLVVAGVFFLFAAPETLKFMCNLTVSFDVAVVCCLTVRAALQACNAAEGNPTVLPIWSAQLPVDAARVAFVAGGEAQSLRQEVLQLCASRTWSMTGDGAVEVRCCVSVMYL